MIDELRMIHNVNNSCVRTLAAWLNDVDDDIIYLLDLCLCFYFRVSFFLMLLL